MITVKDVCIHQGTFALGGITFEIPTGEYAALMGRTGSGKTTILECICGLRAIAGGTIAINDVDVSDRKPAERGIGYVPQDGALFETMTVRDHLWFALRVRKWPRREAEARVAELAELLGIGHLLDRRATGLSGGEQQRVSLGRALSFRPSTLCLDEPLSALDDETRNEMYELLKQVQRQTGVTTLHITHSTAEADALADRVLQLTNGRVEVVRPRASTETGVTEPVPVPPKAPASQPTA